MGGGAFTSVPQQHLQRLIAMYPVSVGYPGVAGGPGLWVMALLFLISIMAAASFLLSKLKR